MPPADSDDISPAELRRSLRRIEDTLKDLVARDTYEADKRTAEVERQALGVRIDGVSRIAWWALGLVGTAAFGGLVTLLFTVAAKGHP